jgi:hypothetical protein
LTCVAIIAASGLKLRAKDGYLPMPAHGYVHFA